MLQSYMYPIYGIKGLTIINKSTVQGLISMYIVNADQLNISS
jgi:hypothetical protein